MKTGFCGASRMGRAAVSAFAVLLGCAALLAAPESHALTKMRDGFAAMVLTDGTSFLPRTRITRAESGDDIVYWIQWQEPIPRSQLRCVISGPGTNIDETEPTVDPNPEGYTVCGITTEDSDSGTFVFTQYLNGEKVGEQSIVVEKPPFFRSAKKRWKFMLGILALIIIAGYWIRRKMTGDQRSLKELVGGEPGAAKAALAGVVIGSKVGAGAPATKSVATPQSNEADDLRKLGKKFEWLLTQPDKPAAVEAGRNYLGLLMKAKNEAEALKVFKQCVGADPAFKLAQAEDVLPLAKAARAAGDPSGAVAVVRGFDKAFPGHGLIPDVFIFSAKLLAEDLNNKDMARKILAHVMQRYPGHYLAQDAKRYLQEMQQATT